MTAIDLSIRARLAEIAQHAYNDNDQFLRDLLQAYGYSASNLIIQKDKDQTSAQNETLYPNVVYAKFLPQPSSYAQLSATLSGLCQHLFVEAYEPRYVLATDFQKIVAWCRRTGKKLTTSLSDLERHADFFQDWLITDDPISLEKDFQDDNFASSNPSPSSTLDRRAADYAKVLYDELIKLNQNSSQDSISTKTHLNHFFGFLLFCFFAESLGIFAPQSFSSLMTDETAVDGSDLQNFFQELAEYLLKIISATKKFPNSADSNSVQKNKKLQCKNKNKFSELIWQKLKIDQKTFITFENFLKNILSADGLSIPYFDAETRKLLLRSGQFNWLLISPDIFGTMFQSIAHKKQRSVYGADYTSTENVLKVIEPLFLDDLRTKFAKNFTDSEKLQELLVELENLRIFDPACGSGNFLIISYKKLREIERDVLLRLRELGEEKSHQTSFVHLEHFYGIELEDLPQILAQLSLVLAKYQMDIVFQRAKLPITYQVENINIVCGNAIRIDWQKFCPAVSLVKKTTVEKRSKSSAEQKIQTTTEQKIVTEKENKTEKIAVRKIEKNITENNAEENEIVDWEKINSIRGERQFNSEVIKVYLVGNPPYKGSTKQTAAQKKDFADYFGEESYSKNLNYIALWLIKGARYIEGKRAELAFIVSDSVCQGEQVDLIFSKVFAANVEIGFAHRPFHWTNNAKNQAGVDVAIINLRCPSNRKKYLFSGSTKTVATEINAYLVDSARRTIVHRRSRPLADLPPLVVGSMPLDGGALVLGSAELRELLNAGVPKNFLRPFLGAEEILNLPLSTIMNDIDIEEVSSSSPIKKQNPSSAARSQDALRWCLWIEDRDYLTAKQYPLLAGRCARVADYRRRSRRQTTKKAARFPYRFAENRHQNSTRALVIPGLCSRQREYFPMVFLTSKNLIFSNTVSVVYDAPLWLFALLESKQHTIWLRTVCSTLGDSDRYNASLAYNTFPIPNLSNDDKTRLAKSAQAILRQRQYFSTQSLAELYRSLPEALKAAHLANDQLVDQLYGQNRPDDSMRLTRLFELYDAKLNP